MKNFTQQTLFTCLFIFSIAPLIVAHEQQKMPIHKLWYKVARQAKPQGVSRHEKIALYEETIQSAHVENKKIPQKSEAIFRLMSYNVHFFKDSKNNTTVDRIIDVIATIQPDIMVLQEFYLDNAEEFENNTSSIQKKLRQMGYDVIFGGKTFDGTAIKEGDWFGNIIVSKVKLDEQKTYFFKDQFVERGEKRCYLYARLRLPKINKLLEIVGTHLEVADAAESSYRLPQLKELLAYPFCTPNSIIAADFNAVRKQDYGYSIENKKGWDLVTQENQAALNRSTPTLVLDELAKKNYRDSFSKLGWQGPYFTTWSGTVIDFFMLAPTFALPLAGCYVYYDTASDHLPIIMDISLTVN